jgi:hypothetical protein
MKVIREVNGNSAVTEWLKVKNPDSPAMVRAARGGGDR